MAENITEIIRKIAEQSMPHIVTGYIVHISLSEQSVIIPSEKQPLQVGDQWYLLAVNRSKIYYFLDKI